MKVHKVTLMIIDFDKLGAQQVIAELENTSYANDCIYPRVMKIETVDIGEWENDNPLNFKATQDETFNKLFDGSKTSNSSSQGP